ncbi:MAG TPA: RHS repeat-associated core domain-containing protein [Chryseolinea sp.]
MVSDLNKDVLSITYNYLNLPARVNKTTGEYVKYIYDATGRKLAQQVFDASNAMVKRSDYVGSLFMENDTLKFINHAEGRIIPAKAKTETNEYQYHLKDHLGNVRLTFTTKDETETALATLEPNHVDDDRANFLYYDEAILVKNNWFDHTNNTPTPEHDDPDDKKDTGWGAAEGTSTRLTGTDYDDDGVKDDQYGLARSISVMPGDVINMEVWAKYFDAPATPQNSPLRDFILYLGSMGAGTSGTIVDGGVAGSLGALGFPMDPIDHGSDDGGNAPKAYLNYIFMDREMSPASRQFDAWQITTQGSEHGQDGRHDYLSLTFQAKEAGFLYIYVSNDNPTPVEVYFDDFKVTQIKSPVIQQDDYYPFGLTFNSYIRENSMNQDYLYNGKELQNELDLAWLDYGARMYEPDLGRFIVQDKFTEKYADFTPYHYALNNPLLFVDMNGDSTIFYDNNANVLYVSDDGLENSAVIVDDDNLEDFNKFKGAVTKNISNKNTQAALLRKFGDNYMISEYEDFFDDNAGDTKNKNGDENAEGLENEHASYLYSDGQEVRIGDENVTGTPGGYSLSGEQTGDDPSGMIHTHPNAGKRNAANTGTYDHGPGPYTSYALDRRQSNSDNFRNVIVEKDKIYLYTKDRTDIIIPRNKTFDKK